MKSKIKGLLLIGFGAFLGITFPEATAEIFTKIQDAPYAEWALAAKEGAIAAYDYVLSLFADKAVA